MKKAVYITDIPPKDIPVWAKNPRVSQKSFFLDDEWDFTEEQGDPSLSIHYKKINWNILIHSNVTLKDPEYAEALTAMKMLAYYMFIQMSRKPISILQRIRAWIRLLKFAACLPCPANRFSEISEHILNKYIEHLKLQPGRGKVEKVVPSTLATNISHLNLLYDYKKYLIDSLPVRPSGFNSPNSVAGFTHSQALMNRTEAIPDAELKILIDWCLKYIFEKTDFLLHHLDNLVQISQRDTGIDCNILISTIRLNKLWEEKPENFSIFSFIGDVNKLRAACFIIIAFSTGMRSSEILSIKRGSVREEKTVNHDVFYWIDSKLYKGQRKSKGTLREWMGGKEAANCIKVLEKLSSFFSADKKPYLFFPLVPSGPNINTIEFKKQETKVISRSALQCSLDTICETIKIDINLTPHRLRRSFARNIIRWSSTSVLALKDHLKHWSLYMTDWYIGLDPELIEDLEAERVILSSEIINKICTEDIGGIGGRKFVLELERRIKNGSLPKDFRGKAGDNFRTKMIQSIHDSGLIAFPCTNMNYCVFQKDAAQCTKGDFPKVNKCKPFTCSNSFILKEHIPEVEKKLDETSATYDRLTEIEKESPMGNFLKTEITMIRTSLLPLLKDAND